MTNTKTNKIQEKKRANSNTSNSVKDKVNKAKKLEPTRYGDWEKGGRCIDF